MKNKIKLLFTITLFFCIGNISYAFAYFNDIEQADKNMCVAGILDFSLDVTQDFFPTSLGTSNQLTKDVSVVSKGSLNFQYQMELSNFVGDFCNELEISAYAKKGIEKIYCATSTLGSFNCGPFDFANGWNDWKFTVSYPNSNSASFFPDSCQFKITVNGWQDNMLFASGFSDQEETSNEVIKYYSSTLSARDIVINEFLPDAIGPDDALSPNGEWVELYNKGNTAIILDGWYLSDADNNQISIPYSIIVPHGFLPIYVDGLFIPEWLDNTGDMIGLWVPEGLIDSLPCFAGSCLLDAYAYTTDKVLEGKSFARIPDGSDVWYDPMPTPGDENKLNDEELEKNIEPEVITLTTEQLFQQFFHNQIESDLTEAITIIEIEGIEATTTESIEIATSTEELIEEIIIADSTTTEETMATTTEETMATTTECLMENPIQSDLPLIEDPMQNDLPLAEDFILNEEILILENTPVIEEEPIIIEEDEEENQL